MQRFKKPLVWLTLLSLVLTLIPVGAGSTVFADTQKPTTYFSPDDRDILKTANLELSELPTDNTLRTKVKVTNSPTIGITGSFSKVSDTSLKATVDLLSRSGSSWAVNKEYTAPGIVTKDPSNSQRFVASNLTLFPGLNRITFSGSFGNTEGSETFYVLYDKIPYYSNLAVTGSGFLSDISLNEGTRVVVKSPQISLVGKVYNTTTAAVTIDGKELQTTVYNNDFSTPSLKMSPGLNKIKIKFTNGTDSIEISREIYYFTDDNPFIDIHVIDNNNSNKAYDVLKQTPTLKSGAALNDLVVQMLVPYINNAPDFKDDHEVSVDGNTSLTVKMLPSNLYDQSGKFVLPADGATSEEVLIEDSTGPVYRLVTFKIEDVPFKMSGGGVANLQNPQIEVKYSSTVTSDTPPVTKWGFSGGYTPTYKLSGNTSITSIKYLPEYDPTKNTNVDIQSQLPLGTVDKADFYILVETDSPVADASNLTARYLPLGKNLEIARETGAVVTGSSKYVYKVSKFGTGNQSVEFKFPDTEAYTASISYSSIQGILVDNLVDGQTYKYNSKNGIQTDFVITGEYFGFKTTTANDLKDLNAEYFVNGINVGQLSADEQAKFGNDTLLVDQTDTTQLFPKFKLALFISNDGPLVSGENTIEFRGQYIDASGNKVPISKKLRIYIVDENVAAINQFHPGKVPQAPSIRERFPAQIDFTAPSPVVGVDEIVNRITTIPAEFTPGADGIYTTSELGYDLVIRGSGTQHVNLYFGTQLIFSLNVTDNTKTGTTRYYPESEGTNAPYAYDFVGNENDFLIRIMNNPNAKDAKGVELGNFKFEPNTTGSHVYNLELINKTGARTNQRLEISRVAAPYRLLAPQPTVGDQYIVNKNFVRFDIEAEGATKVIIGKEEAVRRTEPDKLNRFTLDYVGLKPDKLNPIKIQIVRGGDTINDTINVYYTSQVAIDTQYMVEKPSNKYTVFNKQLQLSFPKGTIMQSTSTSGITKFYPDTKLLFGIADPADGVVERRNDYGINIANNTEITGNNSLLNSLKSNFTSTQDTFNFTRISNIYWISGGVGELGDKGSTAGYKPATNGLAPYSVEGFFTKFEPERTIAPSQRGSLTLSYNSNVVDEAGTLVTVFKYTEVDGRGRWARVPGEVNSKSHTVTVPFDEFGYYAVYKLNRSFTDITNHPWARNILNGLYAKGIMDYLRSDAFGADDLTTRGEFATLLVKGLNLPLIKSDDKNQTFFDVPFGAKTATWDYRYLETAARAGIITGRTEGFFAPNSTINRQDAAVMISRALELKLSLNDQKLKDALSKSFMDSGKIDFYALPAVQAVTKAKIMSGSAVKLPGAKKESYNFNPTSEMTRAEAGKIAVELLKKSTGIFPKNFS